MKLPFVILRRKEHEELLSSLEYRDKVLHEHRMDLIATREECKNLRYNYEDLLSKFNHVVGEFNRVNHKYNVLKKKFDKYASSRT